MDLARVVHTLTRTCSHAYYETCLFLTCSFLTSSATLGVATPKLPMERPPMEGGLSFDDLMDGIHKLTSAGFPRNDSEALFQDFIRRIPSSNNLAPGDSLNYLDPVQQAQLQQSVQQFQQQAQQHTGNHVLRTTSSSDLQEVGGLEVKNFPRVASLDYLQQLVQQSAASQNLKPSTPAPGKCLLCERTPVRHFRSQAGCRLY